MANIRVYDSKTVKISMSILLEVSALLKEYRDNFVLVGGWAPYFLLKRYKPKEAEFQHIGSIDIDIAFDLKEMPDIDEVYESIRQKLERNGYRIRKSKVGQLIPHSFEKEIQGMIVHVDLLASEYGGTGKWHRHQRIQDILARKVKGLDIAFQDNEKFEIEGHLPNEARYKLQVRVSGVVAVLTMKAIAFNTDITRTKDAYDMYSVLRYYKNGVDSVVDEVKPYLKHKLVKEAIVNLSSLFSTIDSVGIVGLANFILPEARKSEDWEFYRRDAFESVQKFLKGLKG